LDYESYFIVIEIVRSVKLQRLKFRHPNHA
jgi:hypothetical protein